MNNPLSTLLTLSTVVSGLVILSVLLSGCATVSGTDTTKTESYPSGVDTVVLNGQTEYRSVVQTLSLNGFTVTDSEKDSGIIWTKPPHSDYGGDVFGYNTQLQWSKDRIIIRTYGEDKEDVYDNGGMSRSARKVGFLQTVNAGELLQKEHNLKMNTR